MRLDIEVPDPSELESLIYLVLVRTLLEKANVHEFRRLRALASKVSSRFTEIYRLVDEARPLVAQSLIGWGERQRV